jgi:hypothetical protein
VAEVLLHLEAPEKRRIEEDARAAGVGVDEWIRRMIRGTEPVAAEPAARERSAHRGKTHIPGDDGLGESPSIGRVSAQEKEEER